MIEFLAKLFGMFEKIFATVSHSDATAVFAEIRKFFEGLIESEE